jgi:transposase
MSTKELSKLEVMQRLESKQMSQQEASQILNKGIRQVKRLLKTYREQGRQGWSPNNAVNPATIG